MKNLMILGAGVYQTPLIATAKKMGINTIVVSPSGNYPGLSIADVHVEADTRDKQTILEAAIKYKISGILTTGTDVAVPSIGYVIDKLKLKGTSYKASLTSMDKRLMKQRFMESNIPTAEFRLISSYNELIRNAEEIGYPVIIKSADSSGSRGITKAESESDLVSAYNKAVENTKLKEVIVERYLTGEEIGAQAIVCDGETKLVIIHGDLVTPPPVSTPIGHYLPLDISSNLKKEVEKIVKQAIEAVGIDNTIANIDLMIVNGRPYVIEIGARMGATCLPENISIYYGFDCYELLISLALGNDFKIPEKFPKTPNASLLIRSDKSGIVSSLEIPEEEKDIGGKVQIKLDIKNGSKINKFLIGPDRLGHIIVEASSVNSAIRNAELIHEKIRIGLES